MALYRTTDLKFKLELYTVYAYRTETYMQNTVRLSYFSAMTVMWDLRLHTFNLVFIRRVDSALEIPQFNP